MALSGVEAAHDAINNNSVDKVLISEDLTAVRDVYRSNDEDGDIFLFFLWSLQLKSLMRSCYD